MHHRAGGFLEATQHRPGPNRPPCRPLCLVSSPRALLMDAQTLVLRSHLRRGCLWLHQSDACPLPCSVLPRVCRLAFQLQRKPLEGRDRACLTPRA